MKQAANQAWVSAAAGTVAWAAASNRGGDVGGNVGVEDAGNDVAGIELVVGDPVGDRRGGGHQHLGGDVRRPRVQQPAEEPWEGQDVVDLVGEIAAAGRHHSGVP